MARASQPSGGSRQSATFSQDDQRLGRPAPRGGGRWDDPFQYDAHTNTILETTGVKSPTLVDPMAGVRKQLVHGDAQVAGTTTIDGKTLYRSNSNRRDRVLRHQTYRPMYLDNPQGDGSVVRTRVVAY